MTEHTAITIPTELLEQVERGNVLLFIGERLSRDSTGEAMLDRLTAELAERASVTDTQPLTFPQVAQAYEDARGRQALVDFVSRRIAELGDEPQPVHRLIAQIAQCSVLVTTTLSGRLERAFREAGRKLQVVIRNQDIAFENEQVAQLYKLRGSLDQPNSLILTEDDNEQFFHDQASLSVVLQSYLARKTILFIGYDLDDNHFTQLYSKITAALDPYSRRSYAFGETPPPHVARWCKRKGIDVVAVNTTDFLQALTDQLATRARPPAATIAPVISPDTPLPEQPYKLLDYYEADDAGIYFGREREIVELSSQILAHRLTLLYGASGVGKTSLLLAGVAPRLAEQNQSYETMYARALDDPAQVIRRALSRRLPDAALPPDGALVDFLAAATRALGRPLVLILDQFEEFFIRLSPQFRAAFTAELGALCDARDMPIKVVLSLREDWLASVNELERRIPEIFRNRMRVLPLTREQARQAITAPVERLRVHYEPALVEQLLDDLAGSASAEIMPPQLQLVCSALYRRLPASERTITLASYTQIGGARGVLQQYLDDELARLSRDDRALARAVLAELVTSQGTKAVRSAAELALALDAVPETLAPVLERLTGARLLRAIEREDGAPSYELAHEYLIREIELDADAKSRKQAEELIRQEVDNWQRFATLLAADKLALINDARAVLRLGPEAQELLLRSALEVGDGIEYWLGRMDDPAQRARVLADKARTRVAAVRLRTASVLGTQDVPDSVDPLLALALHDPDYGVRDAARSSLAKLSIQRPAIVERLQTVAQSKQREERAAALRTLTWLPLRELPAGLRRPVLATRLQLRTAQVVQASMATPARRAVLLTLGLLVAIVLLTALVSVNTYFIDVHPAIIQGQRDNIIIHRGLPILPGLSQIEVDTGVDISQVSPDQFDTVTRRQLWGLWMLRGKRDYYKWGKDLAVTLSLEDGVRMLWYLSPDEGHKWLLEAAASTHNGSRSWSAQALGELLLVQHSATTIWAYEALLSLLKDSDFNVRASAASALGQVAINPQAKVAEVVSALLPLLKDSDPGVRYSAASALGQAATNPQAKVAEVVSALLPLLKDTDSYVRANAASALGQAATNPQANAAEVIAALLPLLKDSGSGVRDNAVSALSQAATNPRANAVEVVAALLPLLEDSNAYMRDNAATAITQAYTTWGSTTAEDARIRIFETLTDSHNPQMRPIAARALFLIALRYQKQEQHIHVELDTDTYARSREPIARLWSNKVLTMLEIVDLVHPAQPLTPEQRKKMLDTLELYGSRELGSTHFFGEDFTWAAKQASDWLKQQADAQPGAKP
jgi:hypothetical protein